MRILLTFLPLFIGAFSAVGYSTPPPVEERAYDPVAVITSTPGGPVYYNEDEITFPGASSSPTIGTINQYVWWVRESGASSWTTIQSATTNPNTTYTFSSLPSGVDTKVYEVRLRVRNTSGYYDYEVETVTLKRRKDRYYHVKDHLGSVRTTVDIDGNVAGYDEWKK